MRVIELDCRYSSISEAEGSEILAGVEAEADDGPAIVRVSGACSSVFLRFFFSFLSELFSEESSRFLRFLLRSGSSEAGISDNMNLPQPNDRVGKRAPMGSAGGPSACIGFVVGWSTGPSSDLVLSLFFFFLGISVAMSYVSVNFCSRRGRLITHLGYLLFLVQQFPRNPWPFSFSSSSP